MTKVKKALAEMEAEHSDFLNVAPEEGRLLSLLVQLTRAQNVLELGTTIGYSALWLGLGLQHTGGKLTTLELLPERLAIAQDFVERAGLSKRVALKQGDGHELVTAFKRPFDFIFHDADKSGTMDYFAKLYPRLLQPGGLLVVHNAITQESSLETYLTMIKQHPDFDSVVVTAAPDDGFSVSYRHRT